MRTRAMTRMSARSTAERLTMNTFQRWLLLSLSLLVMLIAFAHVAVGAEPKQGAGTATPKAVKQKSFGSAEQAMEAFAAAVKAHDVAMLRSMLGPEGEGILRSGDPIEDKETRERFTAAYEEAHKIEKDADKAWIIVGKDDWPLPIPIVKRGETWVFDTKAGKEELLNRRIGRNELSAMQAALAYVDAQQEYYLRNPQKQKLFQYAQKFVSTPGKRDGLYFSTKTDEKPSPLGPLFEARRAAGVKEQGAAKPTPYHGYYYRILRSQGPKAPGGAYSYVVNGQMIGGHALVAYPAIYGNSGIMTFIVNHDGVIYEKNLGPKTAEIAQKMTRFNPDESWTRR